MTKKPDYYEPRPKKDNKLLYSIVVLIIIISVAIPIFGLEYNAWLGGWGISSRYGTVFNEFGFILFIIDIALIIVAVIYFLVSRYAIVRR